MASMSAEFYEKDDVSRESLSELFELCDMDSNNAAWIIDELLELHNGSEPHLNLTEKYYTKKALNYMQCEVLKGKFEDFYNKPKDEQLIEEGAAYIAQWCQPCEDVSVRLVTLQLDRIAQQVRWHVLQQHPEHPLSKLKDMPTALTASLWDHPACRQVLDSINTTLYETLGFQDNNHDSYNPANSYIDKVLAFRTGIPISLSIMYLAIARRLGVLCELINLPMHVLLGWIDKPHYAEVGKQYSYIDVVNKGRILPNPAACEELIRDNPTPTPLALAKMFLPVENVSSVFSRMARNLVKVGRHHAHNNMHFLRQVVDLAVTVHPTDLDHRVMLARIHLHLNTNLAQIHDLLEPILSSDRVDLHGLVNYIRHSAREHMANGDDQPPDGQIKVTHRKAEVKWQVGMLMQHVSYNYVCVIRGWDERCQASSEWIIQMGVHNLPRRDQQPFYNVLVDDGSARYAAEENLKPTVTPVAIKHVEVGRYFSEFCSTHYQANEESRQRYPDDDIGVGSMRKGQSGKQQQ